MIYLKPTILLSAIPKYSLSPGTLVKLTNISEYKSHKRCIKHISLLSLITKSSNLLFIYSLFVSRYISTYYFILLLFSTTTSEMTYFS